MKYFYIVAFAIVSHNAICQSSDHITVDNKRYEIFNESGPILYFVYIKSGSVFKAELLRIEDTHLIINVSEIGHMKLSLNSIFHIQRVSSDLKHEEKEYITTGQEHYFVTPSAHNYDAGEFNFYSPELFALVGSFGITENLSFSGGMSLFPGVATKDQFYYFMPKLTFDISDQLSMGIQYMHLHSSGSRKNGFLTAVTTIGSEDRNITLGITSGIYSSGERKALKGPAMNLAGIYRISEDAALVTDNFISTTVQEIDTFSFGVRAYSKSGSLDLGVMYYEKIEGIPLPFISYTIDL